MRLLRLTVCASVLSASLLACQSGDPVDLDAGGSTSPATALVDEGSVEDVDGGADFGDWYGEVDTVWDEWALGLNESMSEAFEQLSEGERDFLVAGSRHAPTAMLARNTLASMPEPLGDPVVDSPYQEVLDALESVAVANETAAEIFENDIEEYESRWNLPPDEDTLFRDRNDAEFALQDACLTLAEIGLDRDQNPLDCFGTENEGEPNPSNEFQILQIGDTLEVQIGPIVLTYEALVTTERADWGSDWLAVNDEPDFMRTWWLGMPNGLADPTGDLVPDTVIDPVPFTLDLDGWTSDIGLLAVLGTGSDEIGGLPARYWDVRIDIDALEPDGLPFVALVDAEAGTPVGGIQLGFEAAWRLWTIDHPAGPVLFLQTAFLDDEVIGAAFEELTEEQMEAGGWPAIDDQEYLDAIASLAGYQDGIEFTIE